MVNSYVEKPAEMKTATELSEEPEEKEYVLFTELSEKDKLKMELVESIRHASDRQIKTKLIEEAAKKLEKSTRTIRRMVTKVEQEGLSALAYNVRSDKGQFRISPEWQEKIIKLYKKKRRQLNKKNKDKKLEVNCFQIWKLIEAEAKLSGLKDSEFPSHVTVYKVLEPFLNKKKLRHPGQGLKQFIQTTDGQLEITFLESIPGYTGSNIQKRPQNAEQEACLTLDEFERLLVRFIVDNYNQNPYPRAKNQTRVSRWESMLLEPLEEIDERKLDICLLKFTDRKLQRKGQIQFANLIYKGECLRYCQSEYITLRYDPSNILRLMAYTKEDNGQPAQYLGIIQARDRIAPFSIWEQKARNKRITHESKQLDRTSIYSERLDRQQAVESKKKQSKADNRKQEQKRIDCDRTGLNIVEFKAPVRDNPQTANTSQKKLLLMKPVALKSRENKPKVKPAKVKASNWDRFVNHNH